MLIGVGDGQPDAIKSDYKLPLMSVFCLNGDRPVCMVQWTEGDGDKVLSEGLHASGLIIDKDELLAALYSTDN